LPAVRDRGLGAGRIVVRTEVAQFKPE